MDEERYREAETAFWAAYGLEPAERRVRLATTGTEVRVQIVGEGPPVLFLHGGPNAGTTWAPIVGAFEGCTRLVVDRPGTGLSEPWPAIVERSNLERFADRFVADVLDGLGIERAHVVASSLGGYLALRSAAATPERFHRMVQMACPAFAPGMRTPPFMRLMSMGWFRRFTGLFPPNEKVGDVILRQIGHGASLDAGRIPQAFKDWYLDLQRYTETMEHDGELIGSVVSIRGFDPALTLSDELLAAVATPTLFLWGEDDAFGGREVAERLVELVPGASLVVLPRAGHLPWLDDPEGIGRRARDFLVGAEDLQPGTR